MRTAACSASPLEHALHNEAEPRVAGNVGALDWLPRHADRRLGQHLGKKGGGEVRIAGCAPCLSIGVHCPFGLHYPQRSPSDGKLDAVACSKRLSKWLRKVSTKWPWKKP